MLSVSVLIALQSVSTAAATAPDPLAGMDCSKFEWASADGHDRAGMTVDVLIDGRKKTLQLDTGSDTSMLGDVSAAGLTAKSVKIGKTELGPLWFMKQSTDGNTLGLDALIGQVVAIDYPRSRICFSRPANFPFSIYSATHWSPAVIRDGHLYVSLKVGTQKYAGFMFDTGSSLLPIFTKPALWPVFTGLSDPKAARYSLSGHSWGESTTVVGAEIKQKVRIGDVELGSPVAYFQPPKPNAFAIDYGNSDGLFGNALVSDRVVLMYLSSRPLFGLLQTTATATAQKK